MLSVTDRIIATLGVLAASSVFIFFGFYRYAQPNNRNPPWKGKPLLALVMHFPELLCLWDNQSDRWHKRASAYLAIFFGIATIMLGALAILTD